MMDVVAIRAKALLGCAEDALEAAGVPACRVVWHPGADVPWDACGVADGGAEGQLAVAVERVFPSEQFPQETAGAHRCHPNGFGANMVLTLLRCAATVTDQMEAPSPEAVTADAEKVSRDRDLMLQAILCCLFGEDADPGVFRLGGWEPLGPNGGCVGGRWRIQVALPACPCPD